MAEMDLWCSVAGYVAERRKYPGLTAKWIYHAQAETGGQNQTETDLSPTGPNMFSVSPLGAKPTH